MELNALFQLPENLDQRSYEILIKEIIHKSGSGFDYIKFRQSVNNLMQLGMDETTAIRSAYMTASTIGLTIEKLEKTAEQSISILEHEKQQFTKALDKQVKDRIQARQAELEQLHSKIQKHEAQIRQLQTEIQQFQSQMEATKEDLNEAETRIDYSRERFEAVYTFLVNQILEDRDKFKSAL